MVEDKGLILGMLEDTLTESGYSFAGASSAESALKQFKSGIPSLLVTDINLGRGVMDGWEQRRRLVQQLTFED